MDRRTSGSALLGTAVLLALVVPRILDSPYVDGVARIEPPRPPAAVGECLRDTPGSYAITESGAIMTWQPVTFVPCTAPHDGEVVFREDALPDIGTSYSTTAINDFQTRCSDRASTLRGDPTTSVWQPDLSFGTAVLGPDRQQFGGGQRWTACAVELSTSGPPVANSRPLAALLDGALPPELGTCAIGGPNEEDVTYIDCTEPHTSESFGHRSIDAGSELDQDALQSSCQDVVTRATGQADLTTEASIAIVAEISAWYPDRGTYEPATLPLPAEAESGWATCDVSTTDGRKLTASLREIGDAPLPWAP